MNNNSMFEHRRPDLEWADINYGDEWKRAYQPYVDEPLRTSGSSIISESSSDGSAVLSRRVLTSSTPTRHWVAAT